MPLAFFFFPNFFWVESCILDIAWLNQAMTEQSWLHLITILSLQQIRITSKAARGGGPVLSLAALMNHSPCCLADLQKAVVSLPKLGVISQGAISLQASWSSALIHSVRFSFVINASFIVIVFICALFVWYYIILVFLLSDIPAPGRY